MACKSQITSHKSQITNLKIGGENTKYVVKKCIFALSNLIKLSIMSYKIIDVQGIGEVYAAKLTEAGINTVEELLEAAKKPAGRAALAEKTGITPKLILTWANHADLMRINGVGPQFSELLEAAGVDTVKEFRHRVAENLAAKMVEINEEKHLVGRVPTATEIQRMIDQAKEIEPMMEY